MKTLNKTLSLVLALVMVFSLFGVASAAKLDDFTDKGDITETGSYKEAVDYLTAAGIVAGSTATTINPKGDFTREQAAKLVAYACVGQSAADAMKASTAPFTDVAADRWSAGYIAYCVNAGIINGTGDGTFAPEAKVTGYQIGKMLLGALGYGVNNEFVGANWKLEVAKYGLAQDIFKDNTAGCSDTDATREEAFLYTFNTLTRAMMVKYNPSLSVYYAGTNPFEGDQKLEENYTIGYQRFKMEKVLDDGTYAEAAHYWAINGKSVTDTYSNDPIVKLATSTAGTPYANLIAKGDVAYIGYSADTTVTYYHNGDKQTDDTKVVAAADNTGNEVNFYDTDKNGKYDTVEALEYHVAKLSANPTINTAGANAVITMSDITGLKNIVESNVKGDKAADLKKDDYVLYYVNAAGTKFHIYKCETVTGQLFGYNESAKQVSINGTNTKVSEICMNNADPTTKWTDFWKTLTDTSGLAGTVFYLDKGKNICGAEPTANVIAAENTVFVTAAEKAAVGSTVTAEMLKYDGTVVVKNINKIMDKTGSVKSLLTSGSPNFDVTAFYTFTENTDGSFNLKEIDSAYVVSVTNYNATGTDDADVVFKKGAARFLFNNGGSALTTTAGTNKTTFIIEGSGTKADTYKAYTGVSNIPTVKDTNVDASNNAAAYVLNDKDGYAIMAVALNAVSDTTTMNLDYAFIGADPSLVSMTSDATKNYYQYPYAVVNGEIKTFDSTNTKKLPQGLAIINGYDDGKVDSVLELKYENRAELAKTRAWTDSNIVLVGNSAALATGFDVVGNTVTVKGDAAAKFVVTSDVKLFVMDGYDKNSGSVSLDKYDSIDALENLRGEKYSVLTLRVSENNDAVNEVFIGIQPKVVANADAAAGVTVTDIGGSKYRVEYYKTDWTSENEDAKGLAEVEKVLVKAGWTVVSDSRNASGDGYDIDVAKLVNGANVQKTYTVADSDIYEVVKVTVDGTAKTLKASTLLSALNSNSEKWVKDNDTPVDVSGTPGDEATVTDGHTYVTNLVKVKVEGTDTYLDADTTLADLNTASETVVKVDGTANETLTTKIAEGEAYLTGFYKVTVAGSATATFKVSCTEDSTGVTSTGDIYAKSGSTVTVANTDSGSDACYYTVTAPVVAKTQIMRSTSKTFTMGAANTTVTMASAA